MLVLVVSRGRTGFRLRSPRGFEQPLAGSGPESRAGGVLSAHGRVLRNPHAVGARRRRAGVIGAVGVVAAVGVLVLDAAAITGGSRALAQATAPPQVVSGPSFSVEEGTLSVATLVATDTDTVAADLQWSAVGGADQSHFTLSDAGELSFAAAKDFENPDDSGPDGVYEVSVSVSDGVNSDTAALSVTVTNVIELETLAGPVDVEHPENWAGRVATYSASSGADAGGLAWSLSGDDAGRFSIDDPGGALRFSIQPTGDDLFLELPDFDNPLDNDGDGTYEITVHAQVGSDQHSLDVEVTVTDAPEPGTLALSSTRPQLGETLTATLTDPDAATGAATYVWERSVGRGTWATLANTAASHVPTAADSGRFLRVTATYQDGHGAANTATARTSEAVTADLLTALAVSTTDSAANSGHALRPSFDAGTLHYSIGCAASDTMTLTATAGSGVRISINGTQVSSGESHTAAVDADSEVRVTLAAASGAATTYFVRCLSGNLLDMTATTASGATGVIEDLIMFGVNKESERSIAIVDSNGAVRFHDMDANWGGGYFRAAWVSAADEYRYSYRRRGGGQHWQVLDQNLEFIANVGTVAPLTDTNQHDFALLDDGNYLLMAYEPVERDLSELTFGTFGTSVRMRDAALQIRTPGGTPLLTWSSHDAIPFEDCSPKFPPEQADYAHVNTLQMVDGDIVASFRGCNTVLRIDPDDASSHKVVWRVGLTNLSDEQWDGLGKGPAPLAIIGDAEGQFCGQHGSSLLPNGHLILFDNGALCMDDPWLDTQLLARPGGEFSRALEYALDVDNGEAVFLRDHSLGGARAKTARVHGHVEKLPNGDWLIGWGEAGPRPATVSVTQADPNTGEEKFWIRLLQANGSSESIRPTLLPPVALADVLPPLEARIVTGAHTSTDHHGAADRPTVAVAFNRPVADFAATSSVSVAGGSVEGGRGAGGVGRAGARVCVHAGARRRRRHRLQPARRQGLRHRPRGGVHRGGHDAQRRCGRPPHNRVRGFEQRARVRYRRDRCSQRRGEHRGRPGHRGRGRGHRRGPRYVVVLDRGGRRGCFRRRCGVGSAQHLGPAGSRGQGLLPLHAVGQRRQRRQRHHRQRDRRHRRRCCHRHRCQRGAGGQRVGRGVLRRGRHGRGGPLHGDRSRRRRHLVVCGRDRQRRLRDRQQRGR